MPNRTAAAVLFVLLVGCSQASDSDAWKALRNRGFAEAKLVDRVSKSFAACSSGEQAFPFEARREGSPVAGYVCCDGPRNCQVLDQLDLVRMQQETNRRIQRMHEEEANRFFRGH